MYIVYDVVAIRCLVLIIYSNIYPSRDTIRFLSGVF